MIQREDLQRRESGDFEGSSMHVLEHDLLNVSEISLLNEGIEA